MSQALQEVALIPLSGNRGMGMHAIVNAADLDLIAPFKWFAILSRRTHYAQACERLGNGRQRSILMHRLILGAPAGSLVDHRDGNGLNNRRSNIRLCDHRENGLNRGPNRESASQYKGVWCRKNRWKAAIQISGKTIHLGTFATEEDAARAYDAKALELHGEFARLNFPTPAFPQEATP